MCVFSHNKKILYVASKIVFINQSRIEMRVAPVLNYMELTVRFKPRAERQPCNTATASFLKIANYNFLILYKIKKIIKFLTCNRSKMVRFDADYQIKQHVPPFVIAPADSFKFQPCGRTPQAKCLTR
jgi:hypothetical protein